MLYYRVTGLTPKKVDAIQPAIVEALRAIGASVVLLHAVGKGCPDLLVGYKNRNVLLEIKSLHGSHTPQQRFWHSQWKGQVYTVNSIDRALEIVWLTSLTDTLKMVGK